MLVFWSRCVEVGILWDIDWEVSFYTSVKRDESVFCKIIYSCSMESWKLFQHKNLIHTCGFCSQMSIVCGHDMDGLRRGRFGADPGFWSGGPSGVLTPGGVLWSQFAQNWGFSLILPEILGARGVTGPPRSASGVHWEFALLFLIPKTRFLNFAPRYSNQLLSVNSESTRAFSSHFSAWIIFWIICCS